MSDLDSKEEIAPAITKTPEERIVLLEQTVKVQKDTIEEYEAAFAEAEEKGAQFNALVANISVLKARLKLANKRLKNIQKYLRMTMVDLAFQQAISRLINKTTKKGKAYFPKTIKKNIWNKSEN